MARFLRPVLAAVVAEERVVVVVAVHRLKARRQRPLPRADKMHLPAGPTPCRLRPEVLRMPRQLVGAEAEPVVEPLLLEGLPTGRAMLHILHEF
jgi:hypothetical protein